jgi:hypothetical protein
MGIVSSLGVGEGNTVMSKVRRCASPWPVKTLASWGDVEFEGGWASFGGSTEGRAAFMGGSGARFLGGRLRRRGAKGNCCAVGCEGAVTGCGLGFAVAECIHEGCLPPRLPRA